MLPDPVEIDPISDVLRSRRKELGFSQADLAAVVCFVDRPTVTGNDVARWERGKRIPRLRTRRVLEEALALPVHLLDAAAAKQKLLRPQVDDDLTLVPTTVADPAIERIRTALMDGHMLVASNKRKPSQTVVGRQLESAMSYYQASKFDRMIAVLPKLLSSAQWQVEQPSSKKVKQAYRLQALSLQATARVLSKVGHRDLAWTASKFGLFAAERTDELALVGSLQRSVVHSLQSNGRHESAAKLTQLTADQLRSGMGTGNDEQKAIYGTLLLAGSVAAARSGDRSQTKALLDEADHYAGKLERPVNHLWTAFGKANVGVHRVATAVASDDISEADRLTGSVDLSGLPSERRVRFMFDVATIAIRRDKPDDAIATMLDAEELAPEQVYQHKMAQQLVAHLRTERSGRQNPQLARLDQRIRKEMVVANT